MKQICAIIVTYNSERHIYECLESLFQNNDIGEGLEVIVVDNCSKHFEEMKSQISELYGDGVKIIANTQNGGYGQGNNVGIRAAQAPIIMIMNPDVRLCEPLFQNVVSSFSTDEHVVLYAATQRRADGTIGRSIAWTTRIHPYIAEPLRFICRKLNIYLQKYMYVSGACFFIRKDTFEKVGLFDEKIFMYNEEDDIHARLLGVKGAKIIYDRNHSYIHLHPEVADYSSQSIEWLKRNLSSLTYMNERDGISREKTIDWTIKRVNITIWSEKIKGIFGNADSDRFEYYNGWRTYLINLKKEKQ